ncbi:unnamed protein product [Phytophthora fragariaefolia]|uniref:Unnamed protein product n=1 Tax=Phytophthora fragariaefolia TaxID=1490495 RepID=A0A9W6Y1T5_9STRA|nr:unnamed protein product [Phytophthora fragariaefolia]
MEFVLQHALDFAYFDYGGREPVPEHVGKSFVNHLYSTVNPFVLPLQHDYHSLWLPVGGSKSSPTRKKVEFTPKYAFNPQPDHLYIHERVTSPKHRCKTLYVFVVGLVQSDAVKFKALPGVCTRLYDIRFGSKRLSIRHFARLHRGECVTWLHSGGAYFENLSATAEFERAAPATCIGDIVDSTRVFFRTLENTAVES